MSPYSASLLGLGQSFPRRLVFSVHPALLRALRQSSAGRSAELLQLPFSTVTDVSRADAMRTRGISALCQVARPRILAFTRSPSVVTNTRSFLWSLSLSLSLSLRLLRIGMLLAHSHVALRHIPLGLPRPHTYSTSQEPSRWPQVTLRSSHLEPARYRTPAPVIGTRRVSFRLHAPGITTTAIGLFAAIDVSSQVRRPSSTETLLAATRPLLLFSGFSLHRRR